MELWIYFGASAIGGFIGSIVGQNFKFKKRETDQNIISSKATSQSQPKILKALANKTTSKIAPRVNDDKAAVMKALEESR